MHNSRDQKTDTINFTKMNILEEYNIRKSWKLNNFFGLSDPAESQPDKSKWPETLCKNRENLRARIFVLISIFISCFFCTEREIK